MVCDKLFMIFISNIEILIITGWQLEIVNEHNTIIDLQMVMPKYMQN